ncbi:MAG: hypothetical protein ACK41T_03645 [Pseudobdellovibrio sp.]
MDTVLENTEVVNPQSTTETTVETTANNETAVASEEQVVYTPSDFKFKYTGKIGDKWGDVEGEIDESVRALIKSKEDEEKWKKYYSKVHGFDFVIDGREKARNELKQYREQASPILNYAQKASNAWKNKDYDTFFETIGVPNDVLQQYVLQKLQQSELPQEQQNLILQNRELTKQIEQFQEKLSEFEQNNIQNTRVSLYNELENEISKPEISNIVSAYNAKFGAGAFQEEITKRGHYIYSSENGRIARPSELVKDLVDRITFQSSQQTQNQNTITTQSPTQKPTIPVAQGGGTSPSGKVFKSLSDLESVRKEKYGY